MRFVALVALAVCLLGPSACHERAAPTAGARMTEDRPVGPGGAPSAQGEREGEELPKVVRLTPQVMRDAHVTTVASVRRALAATLELSGQVAPDPDHIALIGARAEARVAKMLIREGDAVTAGQVVAVLHSSELARRRAEYAAATARAATARRNAERQRTLVQQRLGSDQEAAAAATEATAAEAERDALAQTIRGMGSAPTTGGDPALVTLASPIAGQVVARDAVPGQLVSPNHTLVTVADVSQAYFEAQLFEKDLAQVEEGARAEVRLNGYPDQVLRARVARVASQIDPRARTLNARLRFESTPRQGLRLGLFGVANVDLPRDSGPPLVVVPLGAVSDLGDKKVVFVKQGDGVFQIHPVIPGPGAGGFVGIASGLDAGEEVVVGGVHALKSAALKSSQADDD